MSTAANRLPGDELAGRRRARTAAGRRSNESGTDLVGRDAELAIGYELVDRLRNGRGGVVVVEGEAGAGKSRVVQAWVENAVAGGLEVAEGSCLELDGVRPFGALARALRLGNEGAGEWGGGRFAVIDGIADLVEERAPLVLVLEDVHWADPATLLALHRLVPRCGQTGLLIVLTSRPVPSDSELVSVLALVERLGGSRLPLRPLGAGDAVILAGNIAGARPGPRLMARLDTAAGNPFYVIELVSVLVAEGAVSVVKGVAEVEEDSTPAPLRAAIVRHLRFLSQATMEVLQIAAVLGSSFAVADLAVVLACPASRLLTVLREATETGVLVERGDRLGFRHALVRDVVYEDLSVSMRRALHLQVADHLASEASPAAAVVVATHYRLGADPGLARAVDWVSRAAAEVGPRDAHLGAELIGQVLELLAPRDGRRAGLLAEQARLFAFAGRYAESEASARAALDLAPPPDVEWLAAGVVAMGLGMTGRSAEAIRLLEGLALRASELQQAQIIGLLSMQRLAVGDVAGAHADAVATVEAGRRLGNSELVALGSARACWAAYFRGELEEAVVHGERAVATTVESSQMGPENAAPGHQGLAVALMDSDRMDEARAVLVAHRQGVGIAGGPYNLQVTYYLLGAHGWVTGAWLDGVAEIDSGVALADEVGNAFGRPTGLSFAAIIAAHRGDRDALDGLLARLAADEGAGVYQAADWWLALWARGTAAVLDGRADDGLGYLRSAWTIVTTVQAVSQFRLLGPDVARALAAAGESAAARDVAAHVQIAAERAPHVSSALGAARWCRGLADADAGTLLSAVDHYRLGPRRFEVAAVTEDAGRAVADGGETKLGVRLLREARLGYEQLGAGVDVRRIDAALRRLGVRPGRRQAHQQATTGWASLTPTETEVARLVCEGFTNRRVAEQLYVSTRTVDTHVAHVFTKLDVRSRRELTERYASERTGRQS